MTRAPPGRVHILMQDTIPFTLACPHCKVNLRQTPRAIAESSHEWTCWQHREVKVRVTVASWQTNDADIVIDSDGPVLVLPAS